MKTESIEIHPRSEEKKSSPLVRQSFRIPVAEKEPVQVIIKQKPYRVSNISKDGVGIPADHLSNLEFGKIYTGCELILKNERFKGLTGKIIHYSPSASGQLEHGIRWIDLQAEQKRSLEAVFLKMKSHALENNDRKISKF